MSASAAVGPKIKTRYALHLYDHDEDCAKAELVLSWKKIRYARIVYCYGHDGKVADMAALIRHDRGRIRFPVLEITDRRGVETFLSGSEEIISFLESRVGWPVLAPSVGRDDLRDWTGRFVPVLRDLSVPRMLRTALRDWSHDEDVDRAVREKVRDGFDFTAALKKTDSLVTEANALLKELAGIMWDDGEGKLRVSAISPCFEFSMDDLTVLPLLRTLTCVRGIVWPELVKRYMDKLLHECPKIKTFDHAYRRFYIDYWPIMKADE